MGNKSGALMALVEVCVIYSLMTILWQWLEVMLDGGITTSYADGVIGLLLAVSLRGHAINSIRRINFRRVSK